MSPRHTLVILALASFTCSALGQEPEVAATTPNATTMAARVDELLAAKWREEGVEPAPVCDDAEFMRRAYLDLTGIIPTVARARGFLNDTRDDKRLRLINALLDSPAHATHLAHTWRGIMLPDGVTQRQLQNAARLESWLRAQFADNIRYDRVVADFLMCSGDETGPTFFYASQDLKPEKLGASTARVFLGLQMQCAQCHDHPYDRWTQEDFWGYAAFFARLHQSQSQQQNRIRLADLDRGEVMLPDSTTIVNPKYPGGAVASDEAEGARRVQLAVWTASRDNPYLARAVVNRVWAQLFGRGLVDPVDDFRETNPPSHPDLLEQLSTSFIKTGFDIHELYRALASTKAYQLTSRTGGEHSLSPRLFARMAVKPLTAEQLYDSLSQALRRRAAPRESDSPSNSSLLDEDRQEFLAKMPLASQSATEYQSGVLQALTLINGSDIAAATDPKESGLLVALEAPIFTDQHRIETLFLATLSRPPSPEETSAFLGYLEDVNSTSERRQALGDILWALLNSAEFAMNH